ncbi:hypothetical protein WG922_07725 [Ramlibacter sp. AN1015]|uniref:hypothetical protein n=1 Tax=Ramlibacter sp. AN1015 TaxID=3133428 RepID=UPI0030C2F2D6
MDKYLDPILKLLKVLNTWKRIAMFAVILFLSIGGYVVFENRQTIYTQSIGRFDGVAVKQEITISDASKQAIDQFVALDNNVEVVQLVDVDLYKNARKVVYEAVTAVRKGELLDEAQLTGQQVPLFSSEVVQNSQMISLINGEFGCGAVKDTAFARKRPKFASTLHTSCRVPIPPLYGRLTGYLIFHLRNEPSQYEIEALKLHAIQLAMKIYLTDINKGPTSYDRT